MWHYDLIVCCLRSADLVVMYGTLLMFSASLGTPILRDEWDALFVGYPSGAEHGQALWLLLWGLYETVIIVDDVPLPAVGIAVPEFWTGLVLWLALNPDGCDDGCPQLVFSRR